jgi:hypothetical protein
MTGDMSYRLQRCRSSIRAMSFSGTDVRKMTKNMRFRAMIEVILYAMPTVIV